MVIHWGSQCTIYYTQKSGSPMRFEMQMRTRMRMRHAQGFRQQNRPKTRSKCELNTPKDRSGAWSSPAAFLPGQVTLRSHTATSASVCKVLLHTATKTIQMSNAGDPGGNHISMGNSVCALKGLIALFWWARCMFEQCWLSISADLLLNAVQERPRPVAKILLFWLILSGESADCVRPAQQQSSNQHLFSVTSYRRFSQRQEPSPSKYMSEHSSYSLACTCVNSSLEATHKCASWVEGQMMHWSISLLSFIIQNA